jgi:DNA-binding beta-propeller fold protein YncE
VIQRPAVPGDRLPVALGIDGAGRLLVGDRHKGAIEIRDASGKQVSEIAIPRDPAERPVDPTDVFPAANGQAFWIVDNDNHCLKEIDARGRLLRRIGRRGSGRGELHYPATAAPAPGGGLLVTDVLNARVDVFDSQGSPRPPIGARGVTPGRFYRPKGVAVDPQGRIHVTDSFTGLVQVFDRQGGLLGIWGDASGQVRRLRGPTSIAIDGEGRFYVVEMLADRATVWRMRGRP